MSRVLVVGAGVAGCAAAVAAAQAGHDVELWEAAHHVGGVAAKADHRTLCGLGVIDAPTADVLEPGLTGDWIPLLANGPPFRRGRVWLWPSDADRLQGGLRRRLGESGVVLRWGTTLLALGIDGGRIISASGSGGELAIDAVIDASGAGVAAGILGVPTAPPVQWGAYRCLVALDLAPGPAARLRALGLLQKAIGGQGAVALEGVSPGIWQLSFDVAPGTGVLEAVSSARQAVDGVGATWVACGRAVCQRDHGRPESTLGIQDLFATTGRGICWAAWPQELHGPDGIRFTWPPGGRHGVPLAAVRPAGLPDNAWFVGKGMAVDAEAASALRVTGTCLAVGTAVGRLVMAADR